MKEFARPAAVWGTRLIGLGLIGIGLLTFVATETSSQNYGIPSTGSTDGWVIATGVRDLVIGLFLILIAEDRTRLPWFLGFLMIVPLADVFLSVQYGENGNAFIPHLAGGIAITVVLLFSIKDCKT